MKDADIVSWISKYEPPVTHIALPSRTSLISCPIESEHSKFSIIQDILKSGISLFPISILFLCIDILSFLAMEQELVIMILFLIDFTDALLRELRDGCVHVCPTE